MKADLRTPFDIPLTWFGEDAVEAPDAGSTIETDGGDADQSAGGVVDAKPAGGTGPKLPALYQQLPKAEIARLEGLVKEGKLDPAKLPGKLDALYKEYETLRSQVGNAVVRPSKDAPKEQWDAFWKGIGRPDAPEGYTLKKPDLPKGMRYSETAEKWFRDAFFKAGMPNDQAVAMYDEYNRRQIAAFTSMQDSEKKKQGERDEEQRKAMKAGRDKLVATYGEHLPEKEAMAKKAMAAFMDDDFFNAVKEAGLDNHPGVIQMMIKIGEQMADDHFIGPDAGAGRKPEIRPGLPKTPGGHSLQYPKMRSMPGLQVKDE